MRRKAKGVLPRPRISPVMEGVAFVATTVVAVIVLAFEAIPPTTALRFMIVLHRLEWRAVAMMAPLALGAIATLVCLIMTAATAGRVLTPKVWVWLMSGAFVAPVGALIGYRAVIFWLSRHPHA
jgi:hypothetical protein